MMNPERAAPVQEARERDRVALQNNPPPADAVDPDAVESGAAADSDRVGFVSQPKDITDEEERRRFLKGA